MALRISDLKPHMQDFDLTAKVIRKSLPIEVNGNRYAWAIVEDSSGQIRLNLWRDQVDKVQEGDSIRISKAFVHVKRGERQISTWSSIEKVQDNL